jgi:hypothetical protein
MQHHYQHKYSIPAKVLTSATQYIDSIDSVEDKENKKQNAGFM